MKISVLEKRNNSLFDAQFLSSYLRLGPEQFEGLKNHLSHLVEVATEWSQERLGKTLLRQKLKICHRNNVIMLPYGPVQKSGIQSVKRKGKELAEGEGYSVESYKDTQKVLTPFAWKSHEIEVVYEAGYGETAEDVPLSIRNSILRSVETLYKNGGDIRTLEGEAFVLTSSYKDYQLC